MVRKPPKKPKNQQILKSKYPMTIQRLRNEILNLENDLKSAMTNREELRRKGQCLNYGKTPKFSIAMPRDLPPLKMTSAPLKIINYHINKNEEKIYSNPVT